MDWEAVSAVSNILMTVATFAAVASSLWIANRSGSARVKLRFVSYNALVSYPPTQVTDEFVSVEVENRSNRPVEVQSWSIEFRPSGQRAVILQNTSRPAYTSLPAVVDVGGSLTLQYGLTSFHDAVAKAINDGVQSPDSKVVFHVRYGTGQTKSVKTDHHAGELLRLIEMGKLGHVLS